MRTQQWLICSEQCLTYYLPQPVSLEQQHFCWHLADYLEQQAGCLNIVEVVVGMNNVTVYCAALGFSELLKLQQSLNQIVGQMQNTQAQNNKQKGKHVKIPVRYGGQYGPDLAALAQSKNMSVEKLVELHTQPVYTVYFIGFQAGFPYLGGLPEILHSPRHQKPRLQVEAGSVGIGGTQTGIYPFASPGGWQLLGKTDTKLFDIHQLQPTLLQAGDLLSFVAEEIITE